MVYFILEWTNIICEEETTVHWRTSYYCRCSNVFAVVYFILEWTNIICEEETTVHWRTSYYCRCSNVFAVVLVYLILALPSVYLET